MGMLICKSIINDSGRLFKIDEEHVRKDRNGRAGLEALVVVRKKVENLIDELVEQGKIMDGEEIKQFFDEIIKERKNCI